MGAAKKGGNSRCCARRISQLRRSARALNPVARRISHLAARHRSLRARRPAREQAAGESTRQKPSQRSAIARMNSTSRGALRDRNRTTAEPVSEFTLPLSQRDEGWIDLRERLAYAARELHFVAIASESINGTALLTIAGSFAEMAMTPPLPPPHPTMVSHFMGVLVDASTLFAAQVQ